MSINLQRSPRKTDFNQLNTPAAVPTLVESEARLPAPAEPGGLALRPYIFMFLLAFRILMLGFLASTLSNLSVVDLKK